MAGSFALDLSRFKIKTEKQMSKVVRKICLELFTLVVRRSPVKTGRFRANNQISLNSLPSDAVLSFDKQGGMTIARESSKVANYKLGDTVFIYNNVVYALELEYGHSRQAPSGVYRVSVQTIVNHFDRHARSA